jgi:hypothetical protein
LVFVLLSVLVTLRVLTGVIPSGPRHAFVERGLKTGFLVTASVTGWLWADGGCCCGGVVNPGWTLGEACRGG